MKAFRGLYIILLLSYVYAQDSNCDFVQNVVPGRVYTLTSPNYPNSYLPGTQCRWIGVCPTGYNCRLDCPLISLPSSNSCSLDRLLVSKSGDPQLIEASIYCGQTSLSIVSTQQQISVGLISSTSSPGGRFRCQLSAQVSTTVPACRCGERKQNRIVGGQETRVNEYRMMVGLVDRKIRQVMCGAVLISDRHVLTAAHCLINEPISDIFVLVGEHDVSTGADTPSASGYTISKFIIHPLYNQSIEDYDIAIVETSKVIAFNDNVGPVCLPFKFSTTNFTGAVLTVLGWGTIFIGGPTSNVLRKADVNVISQYDCKRYEPDLTERGICTFTPGKDACQYDSGGPLLYTDPSTGLLFNIALVSHGRSCASGSPGINTRVTALLDWIVFTTQYNFCRK